MNKKINNYKKNKVIDIIILSITILFAIIGAVLYIASYFYGILFLILAVVIYVVYQKKYLPSDEFKGIFKKFLNNLYIPLIGILTAILLGAIILLITGYNPVAAYKALFYGGFVRNWHITILNATPLIFTGLSVAFAFHGGLFNIGAEGQYYIGAMAATYFGIVLKLPPVISLTMILILSGLFAASWNYVPALLKVKTGAHEVITTMMLAHVARFSSDIFIRAMGGDPSVSKHPYVTNEIARNNFLPMFKSFLPGANYRLHTGIILAIITALVVYYILFYTRIGFEVRAVGKNKDAARTQGISISLNIYRALLISGFLAGIAGFVQVTGLQHKLFQNLNAGYGWNGISVALLASNDPIAVIFAAILWGALDAGGQYMARTVQTPNSIVEIIKGIILFLVVARYIYAYIGNRMKRKEKSLAKNRS